MGITYAKSIPLARDDVLRLLIRMTVRKSSPNPWSVLPIKPVMYSTSLGDVSGGLICSRRKLWAGAQWLQNWPSWISKFFVYMEIYREKGKGSHSIGWKPTSSLREYWNIKLNPGLIKSPKCAIIHRMTVVEHTSGGVCIIAGSSHDVHRWYRQQGKPMEERKMICWRYPWVLRSYINRVLDDQLHK